MLVFGGTGRYRDLARDVLLEPGDLVYVLPDHPHWYGVTGSTGWDEVHLVFEGPAFNLCAQRGLIDVRRLVRQMRPLEHWLDRIDGFRTRRPPTTLAGVDDEVCDVLRLLVDVAAQFSTGAKADTASRRGGWLAESRVLLATDLADPAQLRDIAAAVGMSYESWRKRFQAETGVAPARFRTLRRIDAARDLMQRTTLSNRELAASLGFSDEHHLAKQFRRTTGTTTSHVRRGFA
jgi:AraC-like DNA-binding protein